MEIPDKINIEEKKEERRPRKKWVTILLIIMLLFIIYKQIQITYMINFHSAELDANPLVFGAKKYGIVECTCMKGNTMIWFNQSNAFLKSIPHQYDFDYTVLDNFNMTGS